VPATEFTPIASTIGGVMIGASAVIVMLLYGRIAGISGILARLLPPYEASASVQAAAFIVGLLAAPTLFVIATRAPVHQTVSDNLPLLAVAGLLVGFGATYSGGCTSGHGVCGLSLRSLRSFVATLIFMGAGFATVFVVHHLIGA
jgi:uncharacterized membrane protein YedE/YeeE